MSLKRRPELRTGKARGFEFSGATMFGHVTLRGKSLSNAALVNAANGNGYATSTSANPYVISKYEHLKARNNATRTSGSNGAKAYLHALEGALKINGKTANWNTSSTADIPVMASGNSFRSSSERAVAVESRYNQPRKPTKLPKLVMMPSMVVGSAAEINKLRRPSQMQGVKDVSVHDLLELRPLADENSENVSSPIGTSAKEDDGVAKSLWFPVDEKNVNRNAPFSGQKGRDLFDQRIRASVNAYIRSNPSPGSMRTVLDFPEATAENKKLPSLRDENVNLRFHFSQLELEVGKNLHANGVSPTPVDKRTYGTKSPFKLDSDLHRTSPVLLRRGLRDALKLPTHGSPRASMRSEVVQAAGYIQATQTLQMRKDYAKNLERNWMKKHLVEQRQKRRENQIRQTVSSWVGKRVNMATQDFSKAFYSSDEASDDSGNDVVLTSRRSQANTTNECYPDLCNPGINPTHTQDNCSGEDSRPQYQQGCESRAHSPKTQEKHQSICNNSECFTADDSISHASLDVQYSDMDQNSETPYSYETVLKDGQLTDRRVKNKASRRMRRVRKRFEELVFPDSSSDEEAQDELEIAKMTDTDIRAVRLKLNKEEEGVVDSGNFRNITSAILRDLSRLTQTKTQKKKKKKKKKKKEGPIQTMSVRERFIHDFGWLLDNKSLSRLLANKPLFSANASQVNGSPVAGDLDVIDTNAPSGFSQFLHTVDDDLEALRHMDPDDIGYRKKVKKEKRKVLRRKKEYQAIYERKLAEAEKFKGSDNGAPIVDDTTDDGGTKEQTDDVIEEINPEEWEYVTESDEESEIEEDINYKRERRHSYAGRSKPDTIAYDRYVEKPLPPKCRSPTKSTKSSRRMSRRLSKFEPSLNTAAYESEGVLKPRCSISGETSNVPQHATGGNRRKRKGSMAVIQQNVKIIDEDSAPVKQNTPEDTETVVYQHENGDTEMASTEDLGIPQPRDGFFIDIESAQIDCRVIRRTKSWRCLYPNEEEVSLHDLLQGIDIPAKDIKIQIINRRRKRQRQKMEQQREHVEQMEQPKNDVIEQAASEAGGEASEAESEGTNRTMSFCEDAPFLSAYLEWNRANKFKSGFTDQQLDEEIEDLSDLFWEMKDCRYIRWGKREQAIITRLYELDLFDR